MRLRSIILFLILSFSIYAQNMWAVAVMPAPLLNTPDFKSIFGGTDGTIVNTDEYGHIRALEFIAFEGTVFEIIHTSEFPDHKIYKVLTEEYNYDAELFVDSRFVKITNEFPGKRNIQIPSKEKIYKYLDKAVDMPYRWGGNFINGINKMLEFYKPSVQLDKVAEEEWTMKGVDCSGLMYEATNGYTERNTSKLITFGDPVNIEGMSANQIMSVLKPLDMIVWNGHVVYVYDENTAIESSPSGGVHKSDLWDELQSIMNTKRPVNNYVNSKGNRFVVRRWFYE